MEDDPIPAGAAEPRSKRRRVEGGGGHQGGGRGGALQGRGGRGHDATPQTPLTPLQQIFQTYSTVYDDSTARRERLIKASRDLTSESKKLIFLLHRSQGLLDDATVQEAEQRLAGAIAQPMVRIARDATGESYWRHQRSFSPGMQEFVEAVAFFHYRRFGTLISLEEANSTVSGLLAGASQGEAGEAGAAELPMGLEVNVTDFLLGLQDLGGEVMRYCTSAKSNEATAQGLAFMRSMSQWFNSLGSQGIHKDWVAKCQTTSQSLQKLERLSYFRRIRKDEFPDLPDVLPSDADHMEASKDDANELF